MRARAREREREREREKEGVWNLEIDRFQERYLAGNDDFGEQGGKENLHP
jgi:hypothetical protein